MVNNAKKIVFFRYLQSADEWHILTMTFELSGGKFLKTSQDNNFV